MRLFFVHLLLLSLCALFFNVKFTSGECYSVDKGWHYSSIIPFHGFKTEKKISSHIMLKQDTSQYMFSPDDPKGHLCSTSWNKLYGSTRCGFLHGPHSDSDRFVWRRALSCLIFEGDKVIGEKPNCEEKNMIEIAAYAYDDGREPYNHQNDLLKIFNTKVKVEQWYIYGIEYHSNFTRYQILDDHQVLLEEKVINHRECNHYDQGTYLTLYFGGQCTAPQTVTACYQK